MEELKKVIKKYYPKAQHGIFFCRNWIGDPMTNIYTKDGYAIDICYRYEYFEVFGLTITEIKELKEYYDSLDEEN